MPASIRVLVATDGSDHSRAAAEILRALPLPETGEAIVLSVTPRLPEFVSGHEQLNRESEEAAQQIATVEAEQLKAVGWRTKVLLRAGNVAEQIVSAADELGAQLIVVGSHGTSGLAHFLLGSVAENVVQHAHCSVLVGWAKPDADVDATSPSAATPAKILLAYDGSSPAEAAVELLVQWRLGKRASVTMLGVQTVATTLYRMDIAERSSASWAERKQVLQVELDEAEKLLRQGVAEVTAELREGGTDASHEILAAAKEIAADLIVMGHKGNTGVARFLLGSVSNAVVHHARRSVLVVRP